jgi:hypothetical protein
MANKQNSPLRNTITRKLLTFFKFENWAQEHVRPKLRVAVKMEHIKDAPVAETAPRRLLISVGSENLAQGCTIRYTTASRRKNCKDKNVPLGQTPPEKTNRFFCFDNQTQASPKYYHAVRH